MKVGRSMLIGLAVAVFLSALGVVYSKHESRRLFVQLQKIQRDGDALNLEWGRLQLEQSTWATQGRIERIAREKLNMTRPKPEQVYIIQP